MTPGMPLPDPPLVSVVTPFYNSETYLDESIGSVLAQTYTNFEYVLVDNCSTDRSAAIAERYAAADPRIRLLRNESFLTQLQNYNQALRRISPDSRYVKMVQADDAIYPRCLEEMVGVAAANPSVGVVSSYRVVGNGVGPAGVPRGKVVMSGREACRMNLLDDLYLFGSQTTVMMRADLVRARHPFYTEDGHFTDSDAIYEVLVGCDFAFVQQVLTYSRVEKNSKAGHIKSYEPLILDRLLRLKRYGPMYLSPDEYDACVTEQERVYRRFLGTAWLRRREPEFWAFHRQELAAIGEDIHATRLVHGIALSLAKHAAWPQIVARYALRRGREMLRRS